MKKITLFSVLILLISLSSCYKEGPMGPMGPQGVQGLTGPSGASGKDGTNGTNGQDGHDLYYYWKITQGCTVYDTNCTIGDMIDDMRGTNGKDGKDGLNGKDGKDGKCDCNTTKPPKDECQEGDCFPGDGGVVGDSGGPGVIMIVMFIMGLLAFVAIKED